MKKMMFKFLSIFILSAFTLISCQNEENEYNETIAPKNKQAVSVNDVFSEMLKSKFSAFEIVRDVSLIDEDGWEFTLIEAEITNDLKSYFLYDITHNVQIAYIENNNDLLEITDLVNNYEIQILNAKTLLNYERNNSNLMDMAIDNQVNGIIIGGGKRFWGWTCGPKYSIEPGSCYKNCEYSVFWSKSSDSKMKIVGCDTHPGAKQDDTIAIPDYGTEIN